MLRCQGLFRAPGIAVCSPCARHRWCFPPDLWGQSELLRKRYQSTLIHDPAASYWLRNYSGLLADWGFCCWESEPCRLYLHLDLRKAEVVWTQLSPPWGTSGHCPSTGSAEPWAAPGEQSWFPSLSGVAMNQSSCQGSGSAASQQFCLGNQAKDTAVAAHAHTGPVAAQQALNSLSLDVFNKRLSWFSQWGGVELWEIV